MVAGSDCSGLRCISPKSFFCLERGGGALNPIGETR
jgi:hypothetical protein